jgi:SNF2 family DNA or RNA helicase
VPPPTSQNQKASRIIVAESEDSDASEDFDNMNGKYTSPSGDDEPIRKVLAPNRAKRTAPPTKLAPEKKKIRIEHETSSDRSDDEPIRKMKVDQKRKTPTKAPIVQYRPTPNVRQAKNFDPLEESPSYKNPAHKLKDYQLVGVNWLLKNWYKRRNSLLGDEMGLGKTIVRNLL